jgi:predicted PurR-regulated permease PerM
MQNNRWVQALVILLVIIASAWLIAQLWSFLLQFSNVLLLFFVSWLLAFILRPIARWLTSRGLPHGAGVAIVYLGLAVLITVGAVYAVPEITTQVNNFILAINNGSLVQAGEDFLRSWNLSEREIQELYTNIANRVQEGAVQALQGAAGFLGQLATTFFQIILIILLSFYFMKDGEKIANNLLGLMPPRWQDETRLAALSIEKSFGGFLRGQIVFAIVYAVITAVIMMIPPFQLDYVLVTSIIAGLFMLIPLVGNILALGPPMIALFLTDDKAGWWPWFLLVIFVMQSIMVNVLSPRIMSSAIGIHPIYVWAAILIGSQVAGIWGVLFGIPIAGAINLIGRPLMRRIRHQTSLYKDGVLPSTSTASYLTGPLAASLAASRSQFEAAAEEANAQQDGAPNDYIQPQPQAPLPTRGVPATQPQRPPVRQPSASGLGAPTGGMGVAPSMQRSQPMLEDDDDEIVRPTPTLSAKAWRYLMARAQNRGQKRPNP